jgi:redox-sensitive bicupin YhaK (pirin superfamily)
MKQTFVFLFSLIVLNSYGQKSGVTYQAEYADEGDGAIVQRLFPSSNFKHLDPFIMLDDFDVQPPAGFPDHLHKGFEAITYMIEGGFQHRDNLGNDRIVYAGGAQLFTAGSGLIHSEMPGTKGKNRGLQLWLNIPVTQKKEKPTYQQVDSIQIPVEIINGVTVRHIVGHNSLLKVQTDLIYQDIQLLGNKYTIDAYPSRNSFIYVLDGEVSINGTIQLKTNFFYVIPPGKIELSGNSNARFVYLSAVPLNQKIVQRGPFVY